MGITEPTDPNKEKKVQEGKDAWSNNLKLTHNPYDESDINFNYWEHGWKQRQINVDAIKKGAVKKNENANYSDLFFGTIGVILFFLVAVILLIWFPLVFIGLIIIFLLIYIAMKI